MESIVENFDANMDIVPASGMEFLKFGGEFWAWTFNIQTKMSKVLNSFCFLLRKLQIRGCQIGH